MEFTGYVGSFVVIGFPSCMQAIHSRGCRVAPVLDERFTFPSTLATRRACRLERITCHSRDNPCPNGIPNDGRSRVGQWSREAIAARASPRGAVIFADTNRRAMRPPSFRFVCLLALFLPTVGRASAQWVDVAVVDDPVDTAHPALARRVILSFGQPPVVNGDRKVTHGTCVASVIVRNTGDDARVASMSWDIARHERWYPARDRCLADPRARAQARAILQDELEFYARLWPLFPIVNSSHGLADAEVDRVKLEQALAHRLVPQNQGNESRPVEPDA